MLNDQSTDFAPQPASVSAESNQAEGDGTPVRSLLSDIEALIDDARTWFDAEIGYQKSRAGFVAAQIKVLVGLGLGALIFVIMALFGLVVGLIIALTPLITAWGATAVVVAALLLGALVMVRKASSVWRGTRRALDESGSSLND